MRSPDFGPFNFVNPQQGGALSAAAKEWLGELVTDLEAAQAQIIAQGAFIIELEARVAALETP
jgi:hypothetical protein